MKSILCIYLILFSAKIYGTTLTLEEQQHIYDSYILEQKKKYRNAAEKVVDVYNKHKDDYFLNMRLAYLLSYIKSYKNAQLHYEKAANISKFSLEPWVALSILYFNLGDYKLSYKTAVQIMRRDSSNYTGFVRMTAALIKMKDFSSAQDRVEKALKRYPLDPVLLEQYGFILMSRNFPEKAEAPLTLLLLINPLNAYAKSALKK